MCRRYEDGKGRQGNVVRDGHALDTPRLAPLHSKGKIEGTILFVPRAQTCLRSAALPHLMEYMALEALRDVSAASTRGLAQGHVAVQAFRNNVFLR